MRVLATLLLLSSFAFGLQVDEEDYDAAQKHVSSMKNELNQFKRDLVKYDFLDSNDSKEAKALQISLVTNKRLYNSAVDDLAALAFKSLYNEIKKPRKVQVKISQSCGENSLEVCKAKALEKSKEKAIEENGAGLLDSQVLLENNMMVEEKIFSQYTGMIKQFKITSDRVIEGGLGYVLEADVIIEGNLPHDAVESLKPEKITWNFDKHFEKFPAIPFIVKRKNVEESEDKVTNWLGLKRDRDNALFCNIRLAPQYHNTGDFQTNFFQTILGIKAGYDFANWGIYTKVIYGLNQERNIELLKTANSILNNKNYFFQNITAGVQVFFKGFTAGVQGGVAQQEYTIVASNSDDFVYYNYKAIYLSFEASYRIWLSDHWVIDLGGEVGQVLVLPNNQVLTNNTTFQSSLAKSDIHTTGTYTLFADVGFRF